MEKTVDKWFTGRKIEGYNLAEEETPTVKQKKNINSWDCSTSSPNDKNSKGKVSNWDSSSECQETMVEPFGNNDKDCDNWDTESENQPTPKKENKKQTIETKKEEKLEVSSESMSELNIADLSDIDKTSIADLLEILGSERQKENSKRSDHLCLEDLEESSKNESIPKIETPGEPPTPTIASSDSDSGKVESVTQEDTTVWMIPKSERNTSSSDVYENPLRLLKKAKSFPEVQEKEKSSRCSEQAYNGEIDVKSLFTCEGSIIQKTKFECRAMTMDKDIPVTSMSNFRSVEVVLPDNINESPNRNDENNVTRNEENRNEPLVAGPSTATSLDVVSLPDMIGRNSIKDRPKEKFVRRVNSPSKERKESSGSTVQSPGGASHLNESWFLLDETGQYQAVTRHEVNILLNGRSADAVLQGKKEHVISSATLADTISPSTSLSGGLTKESLQQFLWQEDLGGEGSNKKQIELERKMENTLLYIQPGVNLTASIRIIPVDTEMIHIWRRTRDNGSLISSEVDLGLQLSQDSVQNLSSQRGNGHFGTHQTSPHSPQISHGKPFKSLLPEISSETSLPEKAEETQVASAQSENPRTDFSSLLIETRMIVDGLTNDFKLLQSRLDGETSRSISLQGEVNKLRHLLRNSRETIGKNSYSYASILTVKPTKMDMESEDAEEPDMKFFGDNSQENLEVKPMQEEKEPCRTESSCITVNIYTMEESTSNGCSVKVQETNSLLQSNLRIIEKKMNILQEENEIITRENLLLKKKLADISLELEKYIAGTSEEVDTGANEDKESEILRNQVCNLKLELDFLKKSARNKEEKLQAESSMMQEDFAKTLISLDQWVTTASEILKEIDKFRLEVIDLPVNPSLDDETIKNPQVFQNIITSYLNQISDCLFALQKENYLSKEISSSTARKELAGIDKVISGYDSLIDQCRKGSGDAETNLKEDYVVVMMEKASLMEEIKILKTENEMLLESQMEHYEKLKQTMIALKDRKSEIVALETSQKLSEEEKARMTEVVRLYEEEKKAMKAENFEKEQTIEALKEDKKFRGSEIKVVTGKLEAAFLEIKNLEKTCRLKDELINEFKMEIDQLLSSEEMKDTQIEVLAEEVKNLEIVKNQAEYDLNTIKLSVKDSQKEMTQYISHLETVINNSQESLDKTKEKLKESNQTVARLKKDNDMLDKQHHCDIKLYNKTKDELESCKESLADLTKRFQETEKERETFCENMQTLSNSFKEKSEALEGLERENKSLINENKSLKEKLDFFSQDRDESLKEQKDLINKYAMLSKEIQKLQDKYKNVKAECNERTGLIRYLEILLKESIQEYNNRIACLESSITHIIEKIAACQTTMRERHSGVDSEVIELRRELDVTYKERKELENVVSNYYSLMKHLENELQEREKKVDELHFKLSIEQQKATEPEVLKYPQEIFVNTQKYCEKEKIENLEVLVSEKDKELLQCQAELNNVKNSAENERKKMELTIADLQSEIKRYQIRLELLIKNVSNYGTNDFTPDKRNTGYAVLKNKLEEKDKELSELTQTINKYKEEMKMKDSILENLKRKNILLSEEVKSLQNQFSTLQNEFMVTSKNNEVHEKERSEMAEKLLQSIKLIVEEKSARQAVEMLTVEKEKNLQEQIAQVRDALFQKTKEAESLVSALENKKKAMVKLQDDLKKMKSEVYSLRTQVPNKQLPYPPRQSQNVGYENHFNNPTEASTFPSERLESCISELKELRHLNLQLRKSEGQYQAKIVRLEDEIRNARLLIQELQGDLKTQKKSNKMFRSMVSSAKAEIERCVLSKQMISAVADKISRILSLTDFPSRELLSGFRVNSYDNSPR